MNPQQLPQQRSLWWSMLRQRCPRCRAGPLFRTRTIMHEQCPVCGLELRREPGYYLGAMYVSYGLAVVLLGSLMALSLWLFPHLHSMVSATIALVVFLPFTPVVFRYSRTLWIYFDRWGSPS